MSFRLYPITVILKDCKRINNLHKHLINEAFQYFFAGHINIHFIEAHIGRRKYSTSYGKIQTKIIHYFFLGIYNCDNYRFNR